MSREMKRSGIPWIEEVPKEWQVRKLRNLGRFSASGIDKKIVEGEEPVHIINYVDVFKNVSKELKMQEYMLVSAPADKVAEHQVNVGDMIFTPSSETVEDIGVSAVVVEELPNTAFSYHVLRYQPIDIVDVKYRKYITNNNLCLGYFSSCATGTIRKTISRDVFKECYVLLPPLCEQRKIASFLDKKCEMIDEMIDLQGRIVEELRLYKQSIIAKVVTKGLCEHSSMKDSGIDWVGEIPSHWDVHLLSSLFDEHKQRNKDLRETNLLSLSYGKIIRKNINTNEGLLPESFDGYNIISCGDIVFRLTDLQNDKRSLRTGLCMEDGIITSAYVTIRARQKLISAYYHYLVHYYDMCKVFYGMGDGVRQGMNFSDLRKMLLLSPPINEQEQIVSYLDEKCTEIDNLISIKLSKIDSLKEYKKSIIYEYVTGKKEVIE